MGNTRIKFDRKEIGTEYWMWVELALNRVQRRTFLLAVLNYPNLL
jgi:hypothetical protein